MDEAIVLQAAGWRSAMMLSLAGLAWIAVCGIAELLAGLGTRAGGWPFGTGIALLSGAALASLVGVALALAGAVLAVQAGSPTALVPALFGIALSLAVTGLPARMYYFARHLPPIHDISTDTENPPRFVAVLPLRRGANRLDYSATVAAEQKRAYPDIAPLVLPVPPAQAFERALGAARAAGWEIVAAVPSEGRIEATDTTLLFGFKDDIAVRIVPAAGGSRVDVRSVSRVGRSDLGTNARRVQAYLKSLARTVF